MFIALALVHIGLIIADVNLNQSLLNIVNVFTVVVAGATALAFLRAGFMWMFSSDSPLSETKAKHAFGAAIVGAIICLGSITFANLIVGAIH